MLRIISELHHVEMPIGAAHQMRLRPTPHPSNVLDSFNQTRVAHARPRKASA
jgi:hypothetical protein